MAQIDLSIQLYGMLPSGSYNVRAIGTLVAEQYFGDQARRTNEGKNIQSCHKLGHIQAHMVEEMKMRMKPEQARGFPLRMTSSKPVYPCQSTDVIFTETDHPEQWEPPTRLALVKAKNHPFDLTSRARRKKPTKTFSAKLGAPLKGQTGVRQYHRTDLSKILPHERIGLL
ncbi:Hypp7053 [Branchiostoma lanceolatum]|uniref:Hypp7053 protein n=1 Tax=Branchiostoma lanceolatum TaxID=7740 RepID=A0A8J9YWV8_BRALA|nr:Hypp7053 [Branchiostoma lanceolatum]